MPFVSQIKRQTDYNLFSSTTPIVIDNGASNFRIGWAGENDPRVIFRNIVQRPRHKTTGPRSAFDSNVVYQFEIMEYILDFGFDRLGANGSEIDHPVLITECILNPVQSRSKMAELLFETYGVPSVAFGVDAAFSYKYNQQHGICEKDGLAICPGFTTTHVIPFIDGEPVYKGCSRTNIGGYHVTDYLKQLLSLKYPHHMARFSWEKKGTKEAEEKTRCWQLPWVPPPIEEPPSEEEIARKAAIKERQGQRLREMAEAKKSSRINEFENQLRGLEFLLQQLEKVEESEISYFLKDTGYVSRQEIESALAKVTQSLRKVKGEPKGEQAEVEEKTDEKYPLVNIPDNMLTPDQVCLFQLVDHMFFCCEVPVSAVCRIELREKRRQMFLKTTSDGRQRAKQKRVEEDLERERKNQLDEKKRLENPELYLGEMRTKYKELCEKVEQRKRLKTNGNNSNGNGMSGGVGRGERLNAAQRERMRLLTTAAFDRGKGEDNFGAKDEDWQLYKLMSKDNDEDDEGPDEDETELSRVSSRLQEIDPTFVPKPEPGPSQSAADTPRSRPLTKEDFQILLGVERFRCPEILFHPNLVGIDQAGLDEMAGVSMRRLSSKDQVLEERLTNSILMTGGSCLYPGLSERIEAGIRMIRPCGSPIKVVRALDPVLDAWRGASLYADAVQFPQQVFSRMDYFEKGEDWLRRYQFQYTL
ncbi:hypothetical protein DKX38_016328 [Salix brachista]|uniref:Actin-related protein 5 n=2 Tax=Salix TaxID=40685 RepID=A0A5N5L7P8_9ROSI|nr:hypothetical protein DKX38_016328 [Salix brachista]